MEHGYPLHLEGAKVLPKIEARGGEDWEIVGPCMD